MSVDVELDAAILAVLIEIGSLGAVRREMAKCTAPELHSGTAGVVWQLAQHGPMRMSDLAAGVGVDLSVVSRQVAELVADGQVQRRSDPTDGRACLLSLTAAGRRALESVLERVQHRFAPALNGWKASELQRLATDLQQARHDLVAVTARPTADRSELEPVPAGYLTSRQLTADHFTADHFTDQRTSA